MQSHSSSPAGVDLSGLIQGWKVLLGTTAAAMLVGAVLLVVIEPLQQVSSRVIVEAREFSLDGRVGTTRDKEFLPTQAEILRSPGVIRDALRRLEGVDDSVDLTPRVLQISENLKIDPMAGTSILLVRYTDVDQATAANVVNALIAAYKDYLSVSEKQQHQELLLALTERDFEFQQALTKLQTEYEELKRSHIDAAGADPVATARIVAALEEQLATTQSRRLLLEQSVARMRSARLLTQLPTEARWDAPLPDFSTATDPEVVLNELSALRGEDWLGLPDPAEAATRLRLTEDELATLSSRLGPNHPELQSAQAAVQAARTELDRLVQATPDQLQQTLENLRAQEKALQQRYDNHVRLTNAAEVARLEESRKLTEIERVQQSFDTIHTQLQQWQLVDQAMANGRAGIEVSVLEPPTPGERSFVASPLIVMGVSGMLGLLTGVLLLVALPQITLLLRNNRAAATVPATGL